MQWLNAEIDGINRISLLERERERRRTAAQSKSWEAIKVCLLEWSCESVVGVTGAHERGRKANKQSAEIKGVRRGLADNSIDRDRILLVIPSLNNLQ